MKKRITIIILSLFLISGCSVVKKPKGKPIPRPVDYQEPHENEPHARAVLVGSGFGYYAFNATNPEAIGNKDWLMIPSIEFKKNSPERDFQIETPPDSTVQHQVYLKAEQPIILNFYGSSEHGFMSKTTVSCGIFRIEFTPKSNVDYLIAFSRPKYDRCILNIAEVRKTATGYQYLPAEYKKLKTD